MRKLPEVFTIYNAKANDGVDYEVELAPKLADYKAILFYDSRGNANITVIRKANKKAGITESVVLDMSLDNGEINDIEQGFFEVLEPEEEQ